MYKAIIKFRDKQDDHIYNIGDEFPHDGRKVSAKRLKDLSTDRNKVGAPVIEKVEVE